jgi:heptaprenyl diphosphate synthase
MTSLSPMTTDVSRSRHQSRLVVPVELAPHLRRVERRLRAAATWCDPRLGHIAMHLIRAGGRRLRPALVVSAAIASKGQAGVSARVVDAAAAVELLHLASLYHDDVLDCASVRRGQQSANAKWGNHTAILAGDVLLSRAFHLATSFRRSELRRFADVVAELCSGQLTESETQFDVGRDIGQYTSTIQGKTASLFGTSCWLGGSAAGAEAAALDALHRYGTELGLAFQIADDVLDLCAEDGDVGKPTGSDVRHGVFTLPVLLACTGDPGLVSILQRPEIDDAGVDEVRRRVRMLGAERVAARIAEEHALSALDAVGDLGRDQPGVHLLARIADSVIAPLRPLTSAEEPRAVSAEPGGVA